MNFKGKPGPKTAVILPRHKESSGKARKKANDARKRPPVVTTGLNWGRGR